MAPKPANQTSPTDRGFLEQPSLNTEKAAVISAGLRRYVDVVLAVALTWAILYFGRSVFEPIAFALFGIALVWPFQEMAEARMPKVAALFLTILLTLLVLLALVLAIIWSIGDIIHWASANTGRFQAMYAQSTQWLEARGVFITEGFGQYNVRTFISILQEVALRVNALAGFCIVVFLLLTFGLVELSAFRMRLEALGPKACRDISLAAAQISKKIRRYMLIRTIAGVLTGFAVFAFTLSMGVDLAIAWGIISFVLNYIPYIGSTIAVVSAVIFASAQFASWQLTLLIFGGLYAIQLLIGSYVEPIIAGKAFDISPFVMLVAFFFWAFIWGIPGAFIGLPVTIAAFTICERNQSSRWIAKLASASHAG